MFSRTLIAIAVMALSAGSANAVSYYSSQGTASDGSAVAADRSDINAAFDGDANTFYSLGVNVGNGFGGTLTVDVSPQRIASGSVIEVTNNTPNASYPESAQLWLGGSIVDGAWDNSDAVYFGELFNNGDTPHVDLDLGTITLGGQGGNETVWELALNSDSIYSLITLVDTTLLKYSGDYGSTISDGFDVGEFRVAAIPLPASILMLMGALSGLGLISRRRYADA